MKTWNYGIIVSHCYKMRKTQIVNYLKETEAVAKNLGFNNKKQLVESLIKDCAIVKNKKLLQEHASNRQPKFAKIHELINLDREERKRYYYFYRKHSESINIKYYYKYDYNETYPYSGKYKHNMRKENRRMMIKNIFNRVIYQKIVERDPTHNQATMFIDDFLKIKYPHFINNNQKIKLILYSCARATLIKNRNDVQIFKWEILGKQIGHIGVWHDKEIYHSNILDFQDALTDIFKNLKLKISNKNMRKTKSINVIRAKNLGFCSAGISDVVTTTQLNPTKTHLISTVLEKIEHTHIEDKYPNEILKLRKIQSR